MRNDFDNIKEKMNCELAGWKARFLSQAGKTILIKSNLAEITQFTTQGIKIPNYIAKEMDKKNRDFFWLSNMLSGNKHGPLPLVSWIKFVDPNVKEDWESETVRMSMQPI